MKKKANKLSNIDVYELSFCKSPVNRKRYLFTKNDEEGVEVEKQDFDSLRVRIDTDGTGDGTRIVVNGKTLKNLEYFNFGFDKQRFEDEVVSSASPSITCSYAKNKTEENGFVGIENYRLSKAEVNKMITKMQDSLKKFFGEEVKAEEVVEFKKAETFEETIEKAVNTINEYGDSFPEDLKGAVGSIVKGALAIEEEEGDSKQDTDDKKKDADIKKTEIDNEDKNDSDGEDKSDNDDEDKNVEVEKALKGVTGSINKLQDEFKKSFEKFDERLKKVETVKGNKQGLEGQDTDNDKKDVTKNDDENPKWGSFFKQ